MDSWYIPGFFTLCLLTLIAGVLINRNIEAPLIRYLNKELICHEYFKQS